MYIACVKRNNSKNHFLVIIMHVEIASRNTNQISVPRFYFIINYHLYQADSRSMLIDQVFHPVLPVALESVAARWVLDAYNIRNLR